MNSIKELPSAVGVFYPIEQLSTGEADDIREDVLDVVGYPVWWWADLTGGRHFWPRPAPGVRILYWDSYMVAGFIIEGQQR